MMIPQRLQVAVFVGSNRTGSTNLKLAKAVSLFGDDRVSYNFVPIDHLPMFNQDSEMDPPDSVVGLKRTVEAADALLFVTPEYNRSIPTLLKNVIDWASRPYGKISWWGKPAALLGTSPGAIGTAAMQLHLRQVLGALGVHVMGGEAYITFRPELFDETGQLADEGARAFVKSYVDRFIEFASRFATPAPA